MIMDQDIIKIKTGRAGTGQGMHLVAFVAVVAAALLLLPDRSIAGTYSWTDKNGSFHIVDDLSKVPPNIARHGSMSQLMPRNKNPRP